MFSIHEEQGVRVQPEGNAPRRIGTGQMLIGVDCALCVVTLPVRKLLLLLVLLLVVSSTMVT